MTNLQYSSAINRFRWMEALVVSVLGWIPRRPGILLRQLFYPHLLATMGRAVLVEHRVDFYGVKQIILGNRIVICRDSLIDSATSNSCIRLGDRVCLNRQVRLNATGNSQIIVHNGVVLGRGADIAASDDGIISIGTNTYIGSYVCMSGPASILIGANCTVGHHATISANHHGLEKIAQKLGLQEPLKRGVVIEDNCWLDTGVKILDGVRIGQGCVISAGAVVTKDIPPRSVVVGMPGEIVCTL